MSWWSASHVLVVLGLAVVIGLIVSGLLLYKIQLNRAQRKYEQQIIQLMSHYRHDLMNDLQLLFSYIQLKKYDKLYDCLEKIKTKAQQDSNFAKLGLSSLIAYFLSYRLKANVFKLELEMEQEMDLSKLPINTQRFTKLVKKMIELFRSYTESSIDKVNVLSVQFAIESDMLLFDLAYQGAYQLTGLKHAISELMSTYPAHFAAFKDEYTEDQAIVTVQLPLRH